MYLSAATLQTLWLSLQIASSATVVALFAGGAVGTCLASYRFVGRDLVDVLTTAPMVMPPTVLGYYVLVLIGRNSPVGGLYERVIGSPLVFSRAGATVAAAIGAFPIVVKGVRAALESVDPTLVAMARSLGAGPARTLFAVRLPLCRAGIIAAAMLAFARALGDFGLTLMIAGNIPGRTQTAPLAIYDLLQAGHDAQAGGLALALALVALVVLYAVNRLTRRPPVDTHAA